MGGGVWQSYIFDVSRMNTGSWQSVEEMTEFGEEWKPSFDTFLLGRAIGSRTSMYLEKWNVDSSCMFGIRETM